MNQYHAEKPPIIEMEQLKLINPISVKMNFKCLFLPRKIEYQIPAYPTKFATKTSKIKTSVNEKGISK